MSKNKSSQVYMDVTTSKLAVWRYFKKSVDGLTAKCKLCSAIRKCTKGSPTGLNIHLKSIHKIDTKHLNVSAGAETGDDDVDASTSGIKTTCTTPDTYLPPANSTSSASNSLLNLVSESESSDQLSIQLAPTPSKKKKMGDYFPTVPDTAKEKMVSRMVAKDGLPFRVFCTSNDLRNLFAAKGYKRPTSPNSIKSMVMDYGTTLKMKVRQDLMKLKESGHRFTFTCDEWTSGRNRRYLNLNVHTQINSQPAFWNLGLARVFGSMPSETCILLLNDKLSDFSLSLDKDIVGATTDGASIMVKVGKLIEPLHQLCYAHGIQLGISDDIYKKNITTASNAELEEEDLFRSVEKDAQINTESNGDDKSDEEDDNDDYGFRFSFSSRQVDLALEYRLIISKLRKLVKLFKNSPIKNDVLQPYIQEEIGKPLQLTLDCKTRWSSLANMIATYNRVKQCVSKALIDLGYGSTSEYFFSDEEHAVLISMQQAFEPIKLSVDVLWRRDTDLVSAEYTLRFMVRKLEELKTPLAEKLAIAMRKRISERRINATATLLYLKSPVQYQEDSEKFINDPTFQLPAKNAVRRYIKDLVKRLFRSSDSDDEKSGTENIEVDDEDSLPESALE